MVIGVFSLFKARKADEFEQLLNPYLNGMYKQALYYTGSRADADDLIQDVLLELYDKKSTLAGIQALKPWLAKLLYNRFIDRYRKQQRWMRLHEPIEPMLLAGVEPVDGAQQADVDVAVEHLVRCLRALSEHQRNVIALHDIEGYSLSEVSEIMAMPVGTLKSHLHRGRKALKNVLGEGV